MLAQYGETEINTRFLQAEAACDIAHENMSPEQLEYVTELTQEASASLA